MQRFGVNTLARYYQMMYRLLLLLLLTHGTVLFADSPDMSHLQGLGDTRYHSFESTALGHPLHIYVRLPELSKESEGQKFPTVYLLDGGISFPLLSAYYHYLNIATWISSSNGTVASQCTMPQPACLSHWPKTMM